MNYKRLVEIDLKMLWTLTDINPEYNKFINKILNYKVIDKKDFDKYIKLKENFINTQQEISQERLNDIPKWKYWSR